MDKTWAMEQWSPTALPRSSWQKPYEQDIKEAIAKLPGRTKSIIESPYSPQSWLNRGRLLLYLGYPELAVGDVYKALLLCEAFETPRNIVLVEKVRESQGIKPSRLQKLANLRPGKGKEPKRDDFDEDIIPALKIEVYYALTMALEHCLSISEAIIHCEKGLYWFPDDVMLRDRLKSLHTMHGKDKGQMGSFVAQRYPWMEERHTIRTAPVFAEALDHVEGLSDDKCTLKESTLAHQAKKKVRWVDQVFTRPLSVVSNKQQSSSTTGLEAELQRMSLSRSVGIPGSDFLGIFACRNIKRNTHILTDVTVTGVADIKLQNTCENCFDTLGPIRFSRVCCNVEYCSALCRDLAITGYHKETCKRIVAENAPEMQYTGTYDSCQTVYNDANPGLDLNNRLLLRFLATAKAEGKAPLEHETIARLSNQYKQKPEMPFSMFNNIISPIRMLRTIGVNVFTDLDFDTWVLLTISHRVHIHKQQGRYHGSGKMLAINPVVALFNHSCNPNATWSFDGNRTTVVVYAIKDIKDGEEVFVSYIGDAKLKNKAERRELVKDWLGGRCKCKRCENEQ